MRLIVIEFWWAYWFDLLPITEGEDLGSWCTDPDRYVLGRRRPRSKKTGALGTQTLAAIIRTRRRPKDRGRWFTDLGRY